jgi:hypothetical protein
VVTLAVFATAVEAAAEAAEAAKALPASDRGLGVDRDRPKIGNVDVLRGGATE